MKKALFRQTAKVMLACMVYQLIFPCYVFALTSGPSQPEVQSFEPVGTTEMVDMFTGDFTYNIPLMDVEGFPINISYHSGINIEQEASWVGLGWNINPGEINRTVRGIPDDFNGETIEKKLHINDENDFRVGLGANASLELFGFDPSRYGLNLSVGAGTYVEFNNYKGMGVGVDVNASLSTPIASAGIDVGIGSQSGADIDVNAGLAISTKVSGDIGAGIGISGGTGFNSRTGLKELSFGINASITGNYKVERTDENGKTEGKEHTQGIAGGSFGSSIPVSVQNYVPVITNASVQNTFQFQARFGGEVFYTFPNAYLSIMKSTLSYEEDGSRAAYGYLYSENATENDIMDFSRDNDGYYNNTLKNLPLSSMTYDIYSITGQGTGGMFRPFRNDIGTVYDPLVHPPVSTSNDVKIEAGLGDLFEAGADVTFYENENKSGAWITMPFRGKDTGSYYEKIFFKQAGEMTYNAQRATTSLFNYNPQYLQEDANTLIDKYGGSATLPPKYGTSHVYIGSDTDRTARANLLTYFTGEETDVDGVAQQMKILSFSTDSITPKPFSNPDVTELDRYGTTTDRARKHQITEFTQTLADGRRYIYGIPAMNHVTREVTFSVNGNNANSKTGLVKIASGDDTKNNGEGTEEFYSHTGTPAYAYSYLLTSVLSKDYVDVLGDGPTDDDLGSFTKINYTKWDDDYRWRAPYSNDSAQYNPGYWSDKNDDKGSYIMGSKEIWHIRSIETKNYVAEFYVSKRDDGKGLLGAILPSGSTVDVAGKYSTARSGDSYSYKLDSIKLYNKHDRYINESNSTNPPTPIKTVIFRYSYRLCKGIPNTFNSDTSSQYTGGKLTLERIYIKYGNSSKNLLSPYVFDYAGMNPHYSFADKDRWGNYNPQDATIGNYEFPYVRQDDLNEDAYAAAWDLTDIKLPSGGKIHVDYESDDYSYVQNRRTMQMFKIAGVGNSTSMEEKSNLYESVDKVNDYVYFKRRISDENPSLSIRDNYLEGAELISYNFDLDISGTGKYEHIRGYAAIADVGKCANDTTYGYVKLKKELPGGNSTKLLHPATIYGLNIGKYYIPQVIYPGFSNGGGSAIDILHGLKASAQELLTIKENPIVRFVDKDHKGKNILIAKSWIRLNVPGLTKKGGGVRVKQLTLNDSWNTLTSNPDNANYGKTYDYTVWDSKWNRNVSSGVASYEPLIGGDENPFKLPVKYTTPAGRLLPAMEFFQEEPFGEGFFPPAVVGYSHITIKSIHAADSRSSQSEEDYTYYTAKDFPILVDYTAKNAPNPTKTLTLSRRYEETKVMQGYVLKFNDMHGKLRSSANYVIHTDGTNASKELVSGMTYNYSIDGKGNLDNTINAVVVNLNGSSGFNISPVKVGEEMDFTVDSRERDMRAYSHSINTNCNVVAFVFIVIPIPTVFFPDKEEKVIFKSLVSTKVIQQYGILKSVDAYDHGAKTSTENVLYDAQTGAVLLSKTNNEYNDPIYDLKVPAYWTLAYPGMGPSYVNIGYEEKADSLVIESHQMFSCGYGRIFLNKSRFVSGDEVLLTYKVGANNYSVKAWILPDEELYDTTEVINDRLTHIDAHNEPYPRNLWSLRSGLLDTLPTQPYCEVALRALKDASGNLLWPGNLDIHSVVKDVYVKVLRSGRRNNLDQNKTETEFAANPYDGTFKSLTKTSTAYQKVLSTSEKDYSDKAAPFCSESGDASFASVGVYDPNIYPVNIADANMEVFNRYVLGHFGNYRPIRNYIYKLPRDYSSNNIKTDGTYDISSGVARTQVNETIKYDVFGNAIEEQDISGKYSSAQYGYNKSLPVAVASNVRQKGFCFEGFEDYELVVPRYLLNLYQGSYYYSSPYARSATYTTSPFTRYRQNYVTVTPSMSSGCEITNETSHTGMYSFKCNTGNSNIQLLLRDPQKEMGDTSNFNGTIFPSIKGFSLDTGRKYVVSLWFKPMSGYSVTTVLANINLNIYNPSSYTGYFQLKTNNIEGWYKAECILTTQNLTSAYIYLGPHCYYDDIRFVPVNATMKSFVYDPISFKTMAQLDENNFATFYEYDQEGLLVRVKKETEKGIMTISESRRSNSKQ